jgi:hypothetical protein
VEREAKWEKEEAERVRTFTLSDVDLDRLRRTLDYYEAATDFTNMAGSNYPKEYYI